MARSFDREVTEDISTFLRTLLELHDNKRETCIQAIVESYDYAKREATVIPLVQFCEFGASGEVTYSDRPPVTVPVLFFSSGGYSIEVPLKKGDKGLLVAGSRNGETASKGSKPDKPDDMMTNAYEIGFFIPCNIGAKAVNPNGNLTLSTSNDGASVDIKVANSSGTTKFSVRGNGVFVNDQPIGSGGSGGMNLISGDYSNIRFTAAANGKTKIDVYYR